MAGDLHEGFQHPGQIPADDLTRFLEEADRLPGVRTIQRALRQAIDPRPGMRILDAGCGIGLEATRLATENTQALVTGLDRNPELLALARRRAPEEAENLTWLEADLTQLELPDASFDAIRTERVLMYLPDEAFERVFDDLIRLLAPGGRLALFELDYGATILPPGSAGNAVVEQVNEVLEASLPQPRAGRRIPRLLSDRGMLDVDANPFSFAVSEPVWRRIVHATVQAGALGPDVSAWLAEHARAAARGEFVAAFTGVLTSARATG